jgi:nicotinate phosphoribosyltransferase
MALSLKNLGLYTDYYELVMAQGYFAWGKQDEKTVFDYFFRTNPYQGGFTVFAGLGDFLEMLGDFRFSDDDLSYLNNAGFKVDFIDYLKEFCFKGTIFSVKEGEIVFPGEPLMRIEANLAEAQLIESLLLNILNYESLIATKACRVKLATGKKVFADFGLRRAPGLGAIQASRASYIGGASSTSNVFAAKLYGIPASGTQAHAWIQSFANEIEAFRSFLDANPQHAVLLVDTYDTLRSGVPNAITAAKEFEKKGGRLYGIRLDSGDMAFLSKQSRKMLDDAGLGYVKILASNQLNENMVYKLLHEDNAPIDAFGIGTELVTGKPDAALDGVYKLAEIGGKNTMKFSDNIEKETLPGRKQLIRFCNPDGSFLCDGIFMETESIRSSDFMYNQFNQDIKTDFQSLAHENLLHLVFENGIIVPPIPDVMAAKKYQEERITLLPEAFKKLTGVPKYTVGISNELHKLRSELTKNNKNNFNDKLL